MCQGDVYGSGIRGHDAWPVIYAWSIQRNWVCWQREQEQNLHFFASPSLHVTRRAQRGRCFEMGFANGLKDVGRMLCLVGVRVRDWDPDSRSRISKNSWDGAQHVLRSCFNLPLFEDGPRPTDTRSSRINDLTLLNQKLQIAKLSRRRFCYQRRRFHWGSTRWRARHSIKNGRERIYIDGRYVFYSSLIFWWITL